MTADDWADPGARAVAIHLEGQDAPDRATDGCPLTDDDVLVLVNGWWQALDLALRAVCAGQAWPAEIDSYDPSATARYGKPTRVSRSPPDRGRSSYFGEPPLLRVPSMTNGDLA